MSAPIILTNVFDVDDSTNARSEAMRAAWRDNDYRNMRLKKMQKKIKDDGRLRKCTLIDMFTGVQRDFETPSEAGKFSKISSKKIYRCTQGLSYGHKQYIIRYCEPTAEECERYKKYDRVIFKKITLADENGAILDVGGVKPRVFDNMFKALLYLQQVRKAEISFYKMFVATKQTSSYNNFMINNVD
jgi:hypothetical protein